MPSTTWKVTALALAAALILTVGLFIGANLGGDSDETAQSAPTTKLVPATARLGNQFAADLLATPQRHRGRRAP